MARPIEDYALIGDTHTAALVGQDGSVDWLCLPQFDSPACFAALLGGPEHGRWLIGPADDVVRCERRYLGDTAVLETVHETSTGAIRVLDAMPPSDGRADVIRRIEGLRGTVRVRHEWVVRLGYGRIRPWVTRRFHEGEQVVTAVAGPDRLVLRGPRLPVARDGMHVDHFDVAAGESLTFATTWQYAHRPMPHLIDLDASLDEASQGMHAWVDQCVYDGPRRDAVVRSLITLRLLTHSVTGGIVAAPTTSLPEDFGGVRNWDYRYCWLRDAALTIEALLRCGYRRETELWRLWLLRAVAGDPWDLQIMYAVDGSRDLPERELDHLPGHLDSRPVRVGNAAVHQRQTDVLGEVMSALHLARHCGVEVDRESWALQRALVEQLCTHWHEPDHGLWEIRGPARHFTHSRVMVWVALDRAVKAVELHGLPGPVERWRELRDEVRAEVLARGVDHARGTFTQHYDTTEVDASLLVLSSVGFVAGDDPLMLGTIEAVTEDLMREGLLLRYRTGTGVDGLAGDEHPFLACSFWLVSAYASAGRLEEASRLFEDLCGLTNDVGLLAEEYDPISGRMAGNYPQAFSHLALVTAATDLKAALDAGGVPTQGGFGQETG